VHAGRHLVLLDDPRHAQPHEAFTFDAGSRAWTPSAPLPDRLRRPIVAGHEDCAHVLGMDAGGGVVLYALT
jgi:hypothetical protein